jgi:hypothetical protein
MDAATARAIDRLWEWFPNADHIGIDVECESYKEGRRTERFSVYVNPLPNGQSLRLSADSLVQVMCVASVASFKAGEVPTGTGWPGGPAIPAARMNLN